MPNEIYHKSNWGNANAEGFGDVYFDAAATNKLYNHSDYYENSDGTDKILKDLSNKASIVLTPTAYSDGSLNTVIPTDGNGDFDFSRGSSATRVNEKGLVEDVQILSGELVQNGNFEQIGSELVTNGNFETDSDWNKPVGLSISNGVASANNVSSGQQLWQSFTSIGIYKVEFTISNYTIGGVKPIFHGATYTGASSATANGKYIQYVKVTSTPSRFSFQFSGTCTMDIDNVSVKEVGQNWTFGTGWSMGDDRAVFDTTSNASLLTNVSISSGNLYRLKIEGEVTSGNIKLSGSSGLGNDQVISLPFEQDITHDGGADSVEIRTVGSAEGFISNVSVIEITNDTDLPRIDYTDGTGSLLLEPQRTNLLPYSEDFSNSDWFKERATISANTSTSPDGSVNASKIIENTENGVHSIYEGVAISNNIYTFSCFVKKSDRDYCFLQIVTNLGRYTAVFDLVNGVVTDTQTVSSPTNTSNKIEDYGNGWYRVSVTSSNTASTTGYFQVGLSDSATPSYSSFKQPTYIGDGSSSIQIWGAQVEEGSYATSYIPTNGSTVTRSADVANNSGNSDLINSTEGVLYAEIQGLVENSPARVISIGEGLNFENGIIMSFDTSNNLIKYKVRSNNITTVDISKGGVDRTLNHKIAVTYKVNDFQMWLDGSKVASATSGDVPLSLSKIQFSDMNVTGSPFYGNVKCVAVFKEALSDTELQQLTS